MRLITFISFLFMLKWHIWHTKYTIPADIEWGVFSGIKFLFSTIVAINKQNLVNSSFMFNLLQYLSINDDGVVLLNTVLSVFIKSRSKSFVLITSFYLNKTWAISGRLDSAVGPRTLELTGTCLQP